MPETTAQDTGAAPVRLDVRDHVAWITINRPPLNVLDVATNRLLSTTVRTLSKRSDVRVVAITGAGIRAFSSGVDIADHTRDRVGPMLDAFHGVFRALIDLGRPLVAVVRGAALGGGCELVAFADAAIANEYATFGLPEITLGCFPPIAALVLPQVVGAHNASYLLLTGEVIDARRAFAIGLVNEVAPDAGFDAAAEAFVLKFARHSGAALKIASEAQAAALRGGRKPDEFLRELSRIETLYTKKLMATHDASEGITAWREKRQPTWRDD
jgi:cyclohexa-1,5-dienecarbonyl-CoA hydratase